MKQISCSVRGWKNVFTATCCEQFLYYLNKVMKDQLFCVSVKVMYFSYILMWSYLMFDLCIIRADPISTGWNETIQLDLFHLQISLIWQAADLDDLIWVFLLKEGLFSWSVAGEWSESKECHTWAGGCSTEESWTDCHHHSSVQAWRWGHTVSYPKWIFNSIVPNWALKCLVGFTGKSHYQTTFNWLLYFQK